MTYASFSASDEWWREERRGDKAVDRTRYGDGRIDATVWRKPSAEGSAQRNGAPLLGDVRRSGRHRSRAMAVFYEY